MEDEEGAQDQNACGINAARCLLLSLLPPARGRSSVSHLPGPSSFGSADHRATPSSGGAPQVVARDTEGGELRRPPGRGDRP